MHLRKTIFSSLALIVAVTLLMSGLSMAQRVTGKLTGVVTDEEGVPLPGVTVEISSPALMGTRTEVTSETGIYRFINVPVGTYKVVFKLDGFQTIVREKLKVALDSTTTDDIILKPTTLEESITVTAESPVVDVTKSSMTTNYDRDVIEKLPSGRNSYFDIIKMNPGVSGSLQYGDSGSRYSAFGSNSEENGMYVDGIDLSNPEIGTAWLWQTAEMFEEVEVKGVGAGAEYGNFAGAVVNVVTKSGGNTFSGSASYYGQFNALTGDNNPDPYNPDTGEGYYSYQRVRFMDIAFTLGGPVIKDKIWFFGLYQKRDDFESWWQSDPEYPSKYTGNEQFIKLSFQLHERHRLVLSYNHEYGYYPGAPDDYNMPETICAETDPTHAWNAHYTFLISNSAFFELKYSGYYSPADMMPVEGLGGDINQPIHYDLATDVSSNGPWWPWDYVVTRNTANATLSYFAEDFLGGDHDFKVGIQYNRGTSETNGGFGGGKAYYDWYGEPYLLYEYNVWRYGGTVNTIGGFFDDSWKLSDRLTINFGLRFDHHNAYIPAFTVMDGWVETDQKGPEIKDLIVWNSFSPRVGIAYQLTADQKTLFKASYGRYYNYPYIANWEFPGPNVPDWKAYYWTGTEWELWYVLPGEQGFTVDSDMKDPYTDQFSVGLERELFPNFSVGLSYIYKNAKENIGYTNVGGVFEEMQSVAENGKTYTVWNQLNPGEEQHFLTNPPGWGQKYHGIILAFNKRYSNRWMMQANVTWSRSTGLNLSSITTGGYALSQSLVWYTGKFGSDPNDLINARGFLNLDRRWLVKVSAAYNFPLDILASVNFSYQTGRPLISFTRIFDLNQAPQISIVAEEKGTERYDPYAMLDFRLQKTFQVYSSWKIHLFADVFNLLNTDIFTSYWSYSLWQSNYQEPRYMPYPRRVQVGVKIEF